MVQVVILGLWLLPIARIRCINYCVKVKSVICAFIYDYVLKVHNT